MRNRLSATTLGTFEIFSKLPLAEREKIAKGMSLREYENDQIVISVLDVRFDVFFIVNGCVVASAVTPAGKQVQYENLRPGMMFGELSAVDGSKRENDCISVGHSKLAVMSQEHFLQVVAEYPNVLEAVLLRLTKLVRRQTQRIYEYSTYNVDQRICLEILRIASNVAAGNGKVVIHNVPKHSDIAARVTTRREAVTRRINALQKQGILTWSSRTCVIHNIKSLAALCE